MAEVTDIVERVARAIRGTGVAENWQDAEEAARAALAAMLEAVGEPVKGCENCPILLIKTD